MVNSNALLPLTGICLICLLTPTLSQSDTSPSSPSPPTVAECGPRLLPLAPCAPFVQGQTPEPTDQCCDNLKEVYDQQRGCLCLFLNGTALASLPINSTLALQLPGLCSPQIDPSTCSSSSSSAPGSPASQISFKNNPSASAAAPTVTVAPRPSTVRFGMGKSSGYKLMGGDQFGFVVTATALLLAKLM